MTQPVQIKKEMVSIIKVDESQQVVKGIVYKPNELDAHGDWMAPEDIKKSAYKFMKELRLQNIDTKHNLQKIDAYVCESYIAKSNDPDGYPEGSWVVAVKIDDPVVWQGVLNGEYQAFSMYGKAYAVQDVDPPTN
jgi:hypothetical protein